jgi:hypothetical protein
MYYSSYQPPTGNANAANDCNNLVFLKCGTQFTGWQVEATPDPTKQWRFYIAYFFQSSDKDKVGDGVVKIRKSCGLACEGLAPTVNITVNCTAGTLTATSGFDNYIWSNASGTLSETSNVLIGTLGTTYTVVAYDDGACPGTATASLPTTCCDADAGTISPFGALTACKTNLDLTGFTAAPGSGASALAYALILVDTNGDIKLFDVSAPYTFTFSSLNAGMYFTYALSYGVTSPNITTYLNGLIGMNISEIQDDINGGICADLVAGGSANKITVLDIGCGTFPQN